MCVLSLFVSVSVCVGNDSSIRMLELRGSFCTEFCG